MIAIEKIDNCIKVLKKINGIFLNEIFALSFNNKLSRVEQERLKGVEKELNDNWDKLKEIEKGV